MLIETVAIIVGTGAPILYKMWRDSKKIDEKLGQIVKNQSEIKEVQTEVHGFTKLLNHWSEKLEDICKEVIEIKTCIRMGDKDSIPDTGS